MHSKETRKKISESVKKAIAEGRLLTAGKANTNWIKAGVVASSKKRAEAAVKKSSSDYKSWPRIRAKVFQERGRKCEQCGWKEINKFGNYIPVQINHINGNNKDHRSENLIVLCPNCHSLTEYFMFAGRHHN